METIGTLFNETFLGISLGRYAAAFGIFFLALLCKRLLAHLFAAIIYPTTRRTATGYDDQLMKSLQKPAELLVVIAGLFFVVQILKLPVDPIDVRRFAYAVLKVMLTFVAAWALFNMVDLLETYLGRWVSKTESTLDDHLLPFIRKCLRFFIVFMAVIMAIQNLGYSISGLLASLGIGGLAVALAAKDTLSNIFGSIMIILDRPFHIGDWIKAGQMEGIVEEVGFRSTKIRTFEKTLISVPNSVIAHESINNYSRMPKRRIKLTVGVTYETSPHAMREAVRRIRSMLEAHPAIEQEFMLVNFTDFGASSLDILVYCFTVTTVWAEYLDARQDVCLKIMDVLEDLGLEIAFPSRSIYLRTEEGEDLCPTVSSPL